MIENDNQAVASPETDFSRQVGSQAKRMLKARRNPDKSVWFGLGMSGLVGWSVTVPTLIGAAVGIWIDERYASHYSWTLMLLLTGLAIGCVNAWRWVESEYKDMQEESNE
jgi:ATP synthase protein I